ITAKLAGTAAETLSGDEDDFLTRRLPDLLLFGLNRAALTSEQPRPPIDQASNGHSIGGAVNRGRAPWGGAPGPSGAGPWPRAHGCLKDRMPLSRSPRFRRKA